MRNTAQVAREWIGRGNTPQKIASRDHLIRVNMQINHRPLSLFSSFITARKRSLGQGNIFCTCLSFCSQGGVPGQVLPRDQVSPGPGTPRDQVPPQTVHAGRYGQQAGGTHPTGMHSCFIKISHKPFSFCAALRTDLQNVQRINREN